MSPLYVWAAVGVAGLAYTIREELRYRRETKRRVASHTKDVIDANRARRPAHGRSVDVSPGHAAVAGDRFIPTPRMGGTVPQAPTLSPKRVAYSVGDKVGINGKWWLLMTDAEGFKHPSGRCFSRRSTALRACRQANAREAIKHRKG